MVRTIIFKRFELTLTWTKGWSPDSSTSSNKSPPKEINSKNKTTNYRDKSNTSKTWWPDLKTSSLNTPSKTPRISATPSHRKAKYPNCMKSSEENNTKLISSIPPDKINLFNSHPFKLKPNNSPISSIKKPMTSKLPTWNCSHTKKMNNLLMEWLRIWIADWLAVMKIKLIWLKKKGKLFKIFRNKGKFTGRNWWNWSTTSNLSRNLYPTPNPQKSTPKIQQVKKMSSWKSSKKNCKTGTTKYTDSEPFWAATLSLLRNPISKIQSNISEENSDATTTWWNSCSKDLSLPKAQFKISSRSPRNTNKKSPCWIN